MVERSPGRKKEPGLASKLAWFAGLWLASVAVITIVGLIIKTVL